MFDHLLLVHVMAGGAATALLAHVVTMLTLIAFQNKELDCRRKSTITAVYPEPIEAVADFPIVGEAFAIPAVFSCAVEED